jgi:protein-S-isoprenylcysteine O-methyltransferase Ste14
MNRMSYRLAALSLGLVVAAYWWRVLRMARRMRRATGRTANLLPAEPVGRVLRIIWTPIVLVWVVHPFLTALARPHWAALTPLWSSPWLAWPAVAVAAACLRGSYACWRAMGKSWRMGIDPTEKNPLVMAGPFGRVRHPIYALSQVMMLASALVMPTPLMISTAAAHVLLLQWEARREERHMLRLHGQEYADYCGRVARFVPSLARPR